MPLDVCERCGGTGKVIGRMYDSGPGRRSRIRAVTAAPCPVCQAPAIAPADVDD